jgi:hypothetical protein
MELRAGGLRREKRCKTKSLNNKTQQQLAYGKFNVPNAWHCLSNTSWHTSRDDNIKQASPYSMTGKMKPQKATTTMNRGKRIKGENFLPTI